MQRVKKKKISHQYYRYLWAISWIFLKIVFILLQNFFIHFEFFLMLLYEFMYLMSVDFACLIYMLRISFNNYAWLRWKLFYLFLFFYLFDRSMVSFRRLKDQSLMPLPMKFLIIAHQAFAFFLNQVIDGKCVDRTGLTFRYSYSTCCGASKMRWNCPFRIFFTFYIHFESIGRLFRMGLEGGENGL